MPPFNVFKVFGGSNKSATNAYPPQGAPSSGSGRKLSRRRDRHSSHAQPPQMAYPPTLTVISEDDLSRHMSVNEDHGHYEPAPSMAHESYMGGQDMPPPAPLVLSHSQLPVEPGHPRVRLVDPPVQTHYAQFHEDLEDSEATQSDGEDGRKHNPETRSTHSRSIHGQSIRSNRGDPYMGRTPTPYRPASVTHSISDTQPRPIIINNPEPPLARSSRTRDQHRDRPDEHGRRASANVAPDVDHMPFSSHPQGTSPTTQYSHSAYGPSTQPQRQQAPSAHRRTTHRSRKESAPPYLVGPDVNNTYCYIVPRGTNVIFQDEDGHEITRVGKFHPMYLSREPSNPATRKHTVPIVVQDEFGQELYRTGSITHRSYPDHAGTPVRRSPSVTQHGSQPFLPYQHGGPNVVLVDRGGHQIPIATNPYRTTREVRSDHFH
ncbi:hypothetical protein EYR40_005363 [Pleurotus pulmonarius]|nr:hypothetical protein EYR40_005363 [Pleurotus pulmonarius]